MKKTLIICSVMITMMTACTGGDVKHAHGIDITNMNLDVSPGSNFYKYATEKWNVKHPMPGDKSRYGAFDLLGESNKERVRTLIEDMAKGTFEDGSLEKKIGTLYNMMLDSVKLNADGIEPLKKYVAQIEAAATIDDLVLAAARLGHCGISCFFGFGVDADAKDSKMNLVAIGQGGLSMGQRDYYLDDDEATQKIRNAYKEYVKKLFARIYSEEDSSAIEKRMEDVLKVETRLARSFKPNVELRIPEENYHKMSYEALCKSYPQFGWDVFFKENKFAAFDSLNVGQPEAIKEVNAIFAEKDVEAIRNYMVFRMASSSLDYLSDDLRRLGFEFYGKVMSGLEKEAPAWKRGVGLADGLLGEAIGRVYVKKYFPEEAKERMKTLVSNLQEALGERIKAQDWMSEDTKKKALEKLATFYVKIGYPEKWRDYSDVNVDENLSLLDNVMNIVMLNSDYEVGTTVGKPVDRDRWYMTPQTVNAYYNPSTNEICFPAGILQYPFFDVESDDAANYGAIGVVIGHEMTHGFDDQGRKYDKDGNLSEWWTEDDSRRFDERVKKVVTFFDSIKVLPDLHANGALTAGENLADHGGLQVAYTALQKVTDNPAEKDENGFTAAQRFFIAYAGVWAGSVREEEMRKRTKQDPHSLSVWRVNGTLPHIDAWYEAFHVTEKDSMYVPREKRVNIW